MAKEFVLYRPSCSQVVASAGSISKRVIPNPVWEFCRHSGQQPRNYKARSFAFTQTEETMLTGTRKRLDPDGRRHTCKLSLPVRSLFSAAFRRESDPNTSIQILYEVAGTEPSRRVRMRDMFGSPYDGLARSF